MLNHCSYLQLSIQRLPRVCHRAATASLFFGLAFQPGLALPKAKPQTHSTSLSAGTLGQAGEGRHITIGAAAASAYLAEAEYSAVLGSEFSQLQPENETKFGPIHPRSDSDPNPYGSTAPTSWLRLLKAITCASVATRWSGTTRCRIG